MSAYSTLRVTRKTALSIFTRKLISLPDDKKLEKFMDTWLDHALYNCIIVSDDSQNDDAEAEFATR